MNNLKEINLEIIKAPEDPIDPTAKNLTRFMEMSLISKRTGAYLYSSVPAGTSEEEFLETDVTGYYLLEPTDISNAFNIGSILMAINDHQRNVMVTVSRDGDTLSVYENSHPVGEITRAVTDERHYDGVIGDVISSILNSMRVKVPAGADITTVTE